ncbi:MAG: M1 family metallopeptidase [Candidatus Micrarchaeota archaeon]|nr:M1 family metallopeptidase [Candidatus Micrarchaeota archaeon]
MALATHRSIGGNAIPVHYSLRFTPNMKTFRYICDETIDFDVKGSAPSIRVNASELKVIKVSASSGGRMIRCSFRQSDKEEGVITLASPASGRTKVHIIFEGINNDKMYGFYRSSYEHNGKTEYILTSQFEAPSARSAFVCIDEPAYKATYDVSFIIDRGLQAISNATIKSEEPAGEGKKLVLFNTTPKMSTYLLYLGVGKFDIVESRLGRLKVRAITVPGKAKYTKLAMRFGKQFISYLEGYFGIKYPLPKLDLIAIPDFAAGAMENWGAITFREIALLGDEKKTSVSIQQRIAETISHELVHQWFGDLVTMEWWNDIWLNESFATYMAYKAMESVYPQWKMMVEYVDSEVGEALSADQLRSTHPISFNVNTAGEVAEMFDSISYAKGGSVLYMLEDFVGKDIFRKGLHIYLTRHQYGNASREDLWNAIEEAARKSGKRISVAKVMKEWIERAGYPIVEVSGAGGNISLRQKRFLLLETKEDKSDVWPIPVHYRTDAGASGFDLLDKRSGSIRARGRDWIKVNAGQAGLYRVMYTHEMLDSLGEAIASKRLSGLDAWGIENDLYTIVRSARLPISEYLDFVESYCMDAEYPLNMNVSGHLGGLYMLAYGKDRQTLDRIKSVSDRYHLKALSRIGWDRKAGESTITTKYRSMVIQMLGRTGHAATMAIARRMFNDYIAGRRDIDSNIRGAIYVLAAADGDSKTFDTITGRYIKAEIPDEKRRLLVAIGAFRDKRLVRKAIAFSEGKNVRLQDSLSIPAVLTQLNPDGGAYVLEWTLGRWKVLMSKYNRATHMLDRFVDNLGFVSDEKTRARLKRFFSNRANRRDDIRRSIDQLLEITDVNIRFSKRNFPG